MTTYFETSLLSLYAGLIDMDEEDGVDNSSKHFESLVAACQFNYSNWNQGYYFPAIASEPSKYLFKQPVSPFFLHIVNIFDRKFANGLKN